MTDERYIAAHISGDIMWIDMMLIPKSERRKGAGRTDYNQWELSLPHEITRVQLLASDTGAGNCEEFWKKMGFSYQYDGEDLDYELSHWMWKGVNGHATPPTIQVEIEEDESRV